MSEPEYREVEAEERRHLLRSFGYWDIVVLGALMGAGLGFLYGHGHGSRVEAWRVFAGMAIGALCALVAGWVKVQGRARERFFTRWAAERQWHYEAAGRPFEDTPFLQSGDKRRASDFFSGFWPEPGFVLYQHKRIVGSGRDEQVTNYLVLHFSLGRPLIDLLQISPRSRAAELEAKLFGRLSGLGERIELESAELDQHFRISGLRGQEDELRRLLTPSAIVRLLDFQRALPDGNARFEIVGTNVAFLVEKTLSPKRPQLIVELLELWRPIAVWLTEEAGPEAQPPATVGESRPS
jgi:pimeloyl-ACP methyl ester carboxylesterase